VGFGLCVLLFVRALAEADIASAWGRIEAVGPAIVLVLLPFPVALFMDAWSWHRLLRALDRTAPLGKLFELRFAIEAVTNSAPVGPLWADALAPILLARHAPVPAVDAFASITAKRWIVVRMHATFVALSGVLGASAILHASHELIGSGSLLTMVFGAAAFLVLSSLGFQALVAKGSLGARVSARLERFRRIKAWIEERRHHFAHADAQIARLSSDRRADAGASLRMLGLWVFEGLETYVILRLLGAHLSVIEVLSFDAALSVVRSAAMFAPGGIGVQDVGYLAVLQAYGVADAGSVGPAFVVVKRLKEAFWMIVGFVILARSGPRALAEAREAVRRDEEGVEPPEPQSPAQPPPSST